VDSHRRCPVTQRRAMAKANWDDIAPKVRQVDAGEAQEAEQLDAGLDHFEKVRLRREQLCRNARATNRAIEGWQRVRSRKDWVKLNEEAHREYEIGAFLLDRLGAQRHVDPKLMATLMSLRQRILVEWGITAAAEMMVVD